jgi:hypothetical protein
VVFLPGPCEPVRPTATERLHGQPDKSLLVLRCRRVKKEPDGRCIEGRRSKLENRAVVDDADIELTARATTDAE